MDLRYFSEIGPRLGEMLKTVTKNLRLTYNEVQIFIKNAHCLLYPLYVYIIDSVSSNSIISQFRQFEILKLNIFAEIITLILQS